MNAFHSISIKDPWHLILANSSPLTYYLTYLTYYYYLTAEKKDVKKGAMVKVRTKIYSTLKRECFHDIL